METSEGGWTLVWSSRFPPNFFLTSDVQCIVISTFIKLIFFSNFRYMWPRQFNSGHNFLSPSPNWVYQPTNPNYPISTTPPQDENELGSMDVEMWKEIGNEVLIKNTVNNWMICSENGGSLVEMRNGPLNCNKTKTVVEDVCEDVVPYMFQKDGHSAGLYAADGIYYYFYTKGAGTWAVSDPCGTSGLNHLNGVQNPGLWMYVREKDPPNPHVIKIFDVKNDTSKLMLIISIIYAHNFSKLFTAIIIILIKNKLHDKISPKNNSQVISLQNIYQAVGTYSTRMKVHQVECTGFKLFSVIRF